MTDDVIICRVCKNPLPDESAWSGICDPCDEAGDTEVEPSGVKSAPLTSEEKLMLERINRDLGENGGA